MRAKREESEMTELRCIEGREGMMDPMDVLRVAESASCYNTNTIVLSICGVAT